MTLINARTAGTRGGPAHDVPSVTGWGVWQKYTAGTASISADLPNYLGNRFECYTVYNAGEDLVFLDVGQANVAPPDPSAAAGSGLILAAGSYGNMRIDPNDTHFIARAVADTDIYVIGRA